MPLIKGSFFASDATISMSGPSEVSWYQYYSIPQFLTDPEVAVVAWRGTQELDGRALEFVIMPGSAPSGAEQAKGRQGVEHHVEAGIPAHDNLLRLKAQKIGKKFPALRDAIPDAVIAGIRAIGGDVNIHGFKQSVGLDQAAKAQASPGTYSGLIFWSWLVRTCSFNSSRASALFTGWFMFPFPPLGALFS